MLVLRDYQIDIIQKTYNSMIQKHTKPLICLPTGAGKTVIFAWLANQTQAKNKIVWFLVHRRELLDQTIKTFEKFNIPTNNIYIGMVATVANKPDKFPKPDLIIFDEGHHSSAATWLKIVNLFPAAYLIGLTATPCRLDGKPLKDVYDDLIIGISPKLLIDQGYLSKYRYFAPAVADLSGLKTKGSDYDSNQAAEILSQRAVFGDVIKHWRKYADELQTICYCSSIKHSQATAEAFQFAGINAVHFDGNTPTKERADIIQRFRDGKIKILCNVDLIGEGFDISDCWCCVLLRPTMSLGLFIQQAGRSLRPQPNKTAIILDHVGNYTRHGLPDDHREWSLNGKIKTDQFQQTGELKIKQCTECFFTFEAGPKNCPNCGAEIRTTREEIKQIESVRLEEIKRGEERRLDAYRNRVTESIEKNGKDIKDCRNLMEVQSWCKLNGKSSGWGYFYAKKNGMVRA